MAGYPRWKTHFWERNFIFCSTSRSISGITARSSMTVSFRVTVCVCSTHVLAMCARACQSARAGNVCTCLAVCTCWQCVRMFSSVHGWQCVRVLSSVHVLAMYARAWHRDVLAMCAHAWQRARAGLVHVPGRELSPELPNVSLSNCLNGQMRREAG